MLDSFKYEIRDLIIALTLLVRVTTIYIEERVLDQSKLRKH